MFGREFGREKPDVLIVGAGPVGLFGALVLAKRGVRVRIVDKEWQTGTHSYALALHAGTLALLDAVGLKERVLEAAYRVRTVAFYDGAARKMAVPLSAVRTDTPFVAVVRQDVLEALLETALKAEKVHVQWDHEVSEIEPVDDHVNVRIDRLDTDSLGYIVAHAERVIAKTKHLDVPFVVGTDGYHSDVRTALGARFEDLGGTQHFAVFECRTDADLGHELRLMLDDETTNVVWPLPDGYCRWSFELRAAEAPEQTRTKDRFVIDLDPEGDPTLSEAQLRRFIAERAPWFEGVIEEVTWRHVVRFERRMANTFGRHRIWLAGDAAHMTGPVGVQSMNVGLREAFDLAETLAGILHAGGTPDALQAYGTARRAEWRWLLGLDGGLVPSVHTDLWIRQRAARLLPCLPASGDDLDRFARLLGLTPRHSPAPEPTALEL